MRRFINLSLVLLLVLACASHAAAGLPDTSIIGYSQHKPPQTYKKRRKILQDSRDVATLDSLPGAKSFSYKKKLCSEDKDNCGPMAKKMGGG